MELSRDEMMELFRIDPEMDKKTKEKVSKWDPKGDSNVEELGHYLEVGMINNMTKISRVNGA